jgi:Rhodopirellula transposase DDE domain
MIDPAPIRDRFSALSPHLNERERRLLAATEATAAGYGGIAAVSQATGIAASTIGRGLKELAGEAALALGRVRRPGGGRKPLVVTNPAVLTDLSALVEPGERGDPMSPLRWTCKSLRQLAGGTDGTRPPDQPHRGRRTAQTAELQPPSQQQDR